MDFGELLHMAKKNSESSQNKGKFYSTKFAPPRKECKDRKLSDNIKRFLQKREQEEQERQREEREKVSKLLAMRDEKSKNKIRKMLKVTKSANKSVLDDAVNADHTAVTMEGPEQPDADDYGYVSTEANAFYQKYIEKVKDVKEDKGFAPSRPQSLKDLSSTKERVKAAITRDYETKGGQTQPRSITTTSPSSSRESNQGPPKIRSTSRFIYDAEKERLEEERKKREAEQKKARSKRPPPPPMDFHALLKLAEKKQHEPVEIRVEPKKPKEPERLLTSKEKKELEERQRMKAARERRDKEFKEGRIPKLKKPEAVAATSSPASASKEKLKNGYTSSPGSRSTNSDGASPTKEFKKPTAAVQALTPKVSPKPQPKISPSFYSKASQPSPSKSQSPASSKSPSATKILKPGGEPSGSKVSAGKNGYNGQAREFPPRDLKPVKPRQPPPQEVQKTRQFPPPDVQRSRQFPPPDVRRGPPKRPGDNRKPQPAKRRIYDEDEDEYDSDLDDFIDDGDDVEDYSSYIKDIFGYDKSKYRDMDDGDDAAMESNFAQVQREEFISKKIGLQEDLEDMKLEAIEKKRKNMSKKRRI